MADRKTAPTQKNVLIDDISTVSPRYSRTFYLLIRLFKFSNQSKNKEYHFFSQNYISVFAVNNGEFFKSKLICMERKYAFDL